MDLDTVANELYQLAPSAFIATRDARAETARADGDEALARQIKKLRRPTVSAAVLNGLAHQRADAVANLFDIGEQLRNAQADGDGDELRRLLKERQRAVRRLTDEAGVLGKERGVSVTLSVAREVQQTLLAALSHPDAEEAMRAGRLTAALGFDAFDAGPEPASGSDAGRPAKPARDDVALRRAWREARELALEARREADRANERLSAAETVAGELDQRLRELRRDVEKVTADKAAADRDVTAARKARTAAERTAKAAAARSDKAEAAAKAD